MSKTLSVREYKHGMKLRAPDMDILRQLAEKIGRITVSGDLEMQSDSKGIRLSVVTPPPSVSWFYARITGLQDDPAIVASYGQYSWRRQKPALLGTFVNDGTSPSIGTIGDTNLAFEINGHAGVSSGTIVRLWKGYKRVEGDENAEDSNDDLIQEYVFDLGSAPRDEVSFGATEFQVLAGPGS